MRMRGSSQASKRSETSVPMTVRMLSNMMKLAAKYMSCCRSARIKRGPVVGRLNRWAQSAVHNFSFFFLGLIGLCMVIIVENYLRTAIPKNLLLRRIVIALGSVLILTGASHALPEFLFYLLRT